MLSLHWASQSLVEIPAALMVLFKQVITKLALAALRMCCDPCNQARDVCLLNFTRNNPDAPRLTKVLMASGCFTLATI